MDKWTSTPEFEEKVRQSFSVPEIRQEFVDQVHVDLAQHAKAKKLRTHRFFGLRPVWAVALAVFVLLIIGALAIGPQRVYAAVRQLLGVGDPGIQSVQEAGLVTELNVTAQPWTGSTWMKAGWRWECNSPPCRQGSHWILHR